MKTCKFKHLETNILKEKSNTNHDIEKVIIEQKLIIEDLKLELISANTEIQNLKQKHQTVHNTTQTTPQTVHNL